MALSPGFIFTAYCFSEFYLVFLRYISRIFTKQPNKMIREILTLQLDGVPIQYYVRFSKERNFFRFYPTLTAKSAPSFSIAVTKKELCTEDEIENHLLEQAKGRVLEILNDGIYDKL